MRTRTLALAGVVSAAIVLWAVFHIPQGWSVGEHHGDIQMGIFRALAGFTIGVVIFRLYERGSLRRLPSIRPELLYITWILVCAMPPIGQAAEYECGISVVVAPAIIALLVRSERKMAKPYNWMAALSYPLYASHFAGLIFVSSAFGYLGFSAGSWRAIFMILVTVALAQVVRILSEIRFAPAIARFVIGKTPI